MVDPELLKEAVTRLDAAGFQVHFHAIGDGAVRESLDAIEAARRRNGDLGHRDHISHLELVDPADVPRFRELGVIANFQPLWAYADDYITKLTIPFMGPERSARLYPIGTLYRSGAVVAFGSDWYVSSANPLEEIQVAVTRMGPRGETHTPFLPGERIDLPEALAAFTINAAYTNRLEKTTGSIEVGKNADLIVLDHNLFAIPASEIDKSKVLLTLFERTSGSRRSGKALSRIRPADNRPSASDASSMSNCACGRKGSVAIVRHPIQHRCIHRLDASSFILYRHRAKLLSYFRTDMGMLSMRSYLLGQRVTTRGDYRVGVRGLPTGVATRGSHPYPGY